MVSQGPNPKHSEEHLATTDRGLVMLRRLQQKQLDAVKEGGDPAGVFFDPSTPPVRISAGNWMEQSITDPQGVKPWERPSSHARRRAQGARAALLP